MQLQLLFESWMGAHLDDVVRNFVPEWNNIQKERTAMVIRPDMRVKQRH